MKEEETWGGSDGHIEMLDDAKQSAIVTTAAAARRTLLAATQLRMVASASIVRLLYVVIKNSKLKRVRLQTSWVKMTRANMQMDQRQEGKRRPATETCKFRAASG